MTPYRDIKRAARRDLHQAAQIPAYYYRTATVTTPLLIHVRLHSAFGRIGNVAGARIYPAEMEDDTPKVRFDLTEVPVDSEGALQSGPIAPERGAIVSFEAGEAYRIDHMLPVDDQFQTGEVTRLTAAEAADLLVPDPAA